MSSLHFKKPPGAAEKHSDLGHYSQSVDLGNGIVKCSGQGGWHPETGALDATDSSKQVALAMENVDIVLKNAGLRGWEDVYLLRSYHCDITASWEPTAEALKKRIPGHRPIWTAIGVPKLAFPDRDAYRTRGRSQASELMAVSELGLNTGIFDPVL